MGVDGSYSYCDSRFHPGFYSPLALTNEIVFVIIPEVHGFILSQLSLIPIVPVVEISNLIVHFAA